MNTNLLKMELRRDLKVFLIVSLMNTAFLAVTMAMYSGMKEAMMSVTELYSTMPEGFAKALNFQDGQWNTFLGFYATYAIYYGPLFLGMLAIYLGSAVVAREEYKGTAEFLLAKPISRNKIWYSKWLVMIIYVVLANMLLWLNGIIWGAADSGFTETFTSITILHIYGLFICLFFGSLGLFISVLAKRSRSLTGQAIGIVFIGYMLDIIIKISDKADFVGYLTPFKYQNINLLDPTYHMEWWRIAVTGGAFVVLTLLGARIYQKRNILV